VKKDFEEIRELCEKFQRKADDLERSGNRTSRSHGYSYVADMIRMRALDTIEEMDNFDENYTSC